MLEFIAYKTPIFYFIQPFWRDEAFSVLLSQNSLVNIIKLTAGDFNPPFYYFLLNIWMQFFGTSEIAVRALSFLIHIVLIYFIARFLERNYKFSKWKQRAFLVLVFLNPMLLYFAFEVRMYSLLTLFSFLSVYFLVSKNYKWFTIISVLGMYTHYYFAFVLLSCFLFILFRKRKILAKFMERIIIIFLLFLPWGIVVLNQLKNTGMTWFYPVNANLIFSLLGSLYLGFEGTPPPLWDFCKIFSLVILLFIFYYVLKTKKSKKEKESATLFLFLLFVPLISVVGFSFIKRIYVGRYLIFTVLPLIFLYFLGINSLKNRIISHLFLISNIIFVIFFNCYFAKYHQKTDFRSTLQKINLDDKGNSYIVSRTPLSFFEVSYYAPDKNKVFLYNPQNQPILPYLGRILIPKTKWINEIPYDKIIYLVRDDGSYEKIKY